MGRVTDGWRVMGVDPGDTIGVAVVEFVGVEGTLNVRVIEYQQVPYGEAPGYFARKVPFVNLVAIERYVITGRTAELSRQAEALYAKGGIMWLAELNNVLVRLGLASDAKAMFTNQILVEMGLFGEVRGRHARDGLRQALMAARREGAPV